MEKMQVFHSELMMNLVLEHEKIRDLINTDNVDYLDYPLHGNIGDLLIFLGTLKFLSNNNIKIKNTNCLQNWSTKCKSNVILLHGGGNLGDLYGRHQNLREEVIVHNLDKRIIILPQTIFFSENCNYDKACNAFRKHPDLHICVRDKKSFELAQGMSDKVLLLPDMAHQLYPVLNNNNQPIEGSALFLKRSDKESFEDNNTFHNIAFDRIVDWDAIIGDSELLNLKNMKLFLRAIKFFSDNSKLNLLFMKMWQNKSLKWMGLAVNEFSKYQTVYTDRLHAHLLSCLMDKESKLMDNTYGKNFEYAKTWTLKSPMVQLCDASHA